MYPKEREKNLTRQFLQIAYFECLEERERQKITISLVCDKAEVSRKSFYRYFRSLEQLEHDWFFEQMERYLASCSILERYDQSTILWELFSFWEPQREILKLYLEQGISLVRLLMPYAKEVIAIRSHGVVDRWKETMAYSALSFLESWILQAPISKQSMIEQILDEREQLRYRMEN